MDTSKHIINAGSIARDALRMLDQLPQSESRTLLVVDGGKLVGTLTDGDIRRGLLKGLEISDGVKSYMNPYFKCLKKKEVVPEILAVFKKQDIWLLPVVDDEMHIESVINLYDLHTVIPAAALLMAGGRGERLKPLTDTIPKPLLKVGEKPIIEINIDRLIKYGIRHFYISVGYLSQQIIDYLGDGSFKEVNITYIREDTPLGTFGAASRINDLPFDQLYVLNADLLTNINFEDMYNNFVSTQALMSVASIPYDVKIPYGIMNSSKENKILTLEEKPTYTYYANAGIYLLQKKLLNRIPNNHFFNATDLMQMLIDSSDLMIHFPILGYWLDIGKYEDYARAQQDYKRINF